MPVPVKAYSPILVHSGMLSSPVIFAQFSKAYPEILVAFSTDGIVIFEQPLNAFP